MIISYKSSESILGTESVLGNGAVVDKFHAIYLCPDGGYLYISGDPHSTDPGVYINMA